MDNEIPKIDIPGDWIIGTDISKEILKLYTNYPCRLKAEIFVLCMQGEIEATINLTRFHVKPFDFVTLLPGTILQIHKVEGDLCLYIMGYSSSFLQEIHLIKPAVDVMYTISEKPVISLAEKPAGLLEDYFSLLIKTYNLCGAKINKGVITHILSGVLFGLSALYKDIKATQPHISKSEQICKDFGQLVMQHYTKERNVSFYAKSLGITPAHLCTTIKQGTGKTCVDIISTMVILDAKSQLKSTDLSIQAIAYSLHFTNMSFFGKYFKRYVGVSPLEFRRK